jgi:radical SAM superfamily enzyme YgiQ (UPF0313 family)
MPSQRLSILLISPKGDYFGSDPRFRHYMADTRAMRAILHYWNGIGLALPTLAALTPAQHQVHIVDENFEAVDFDFPCDIVGITAMTQQALRAYELADEFRRRGRHVVMGGIHTTVLPDEAIQHCDTIFVGEAENSWPEFLRDYCAGIQKQRYYQYDFHAVELSQLPVPRYDLLARYQYPVVFVQTTRGCPHNCEFCVASNIYGKTYRIKNPAQVLHEVREAKNWWKRAQIGFADDNMFVNKAYSRSLISAFKDLNFIWFAVCDVSIGREDSLLAAMHDSGCRSLLIGFESLSKANLRSLSPARWKEKNLQRYREYVARIQSHGIAVYGSFILGFDHDNPRTPDQIIEFVLQTNMFGAHATLLTPFPGSRLRLRLKEAGRILHNDWRLYTLWNAVISHPLLTKDELEEGVLNVFRTVYSSDNIQRRAQYFKQLCRELV